MSARRWRMMRYRLEALPILKSVNREPKANDSIRYAAPSHVIRNSSATKVATNLRLPSIFGPLLSHWQSDCVLLFLLRSLWPIFVMCLSWCANKEINLLAGGATRELYCWHGLRLWTARCASSTHILFTGGCSTVASETPDERHILQLCLWIPLVFWLVGSDHT